MINNKESFTYKKYLKNKRLFEYASLFLVIDIIMFFYFSMELYYKSSIIFALVVFIFYFELKKAKKELRYEKKRNYFTWGKGAGAELIVKKSLMTLSNQYRVFSDFQAGKWNIDHICIGPTGIFAIEVKAHKGTISYTDNKLKRNNQELGGNYLGQSKKGSVFLNQLLKEKLNKNYFVIPVLIFPNAKIDNGINHKIENVWIGGRGFEKWIIENCNNMLNPEEIEIICNVLKNSII
ncbi:MAG: hypothetical protein MCSN_3460 [Candidatus Microsyncoccus archaeolyticus]|nr:MAG: hypothetical protein MCSN_3460 [Candidatus Parcubacteria bacterium]